MSNLPEQQTETNKIVETETDEAMISEETLNDDPDFQSNSNFTIPNPTQCYPDDLDLTDENFIALCKEYMKTIKITEDGINIVEEKTRGQSSNSDWLQYRCGRLTASKFGEIRNRRVTTPPDGLVRNVSVQRQAKYTISVSSGVRNGNSHHRQTLSTSRKQWSKR